MKRLQTTITTVFKEQKMAQRILVYYLGMLFLAFGVIFSINSDLGVSPISSLPFVLSLVTGLNLGIVITAVLLFYIFLQIIVLHKAYKPINLMQIAVAAIFGYFVDFARFVVGGFSLPTYLGQLIMLSISMVLIAVGIICLLESRLINLPPEGLVEAIAYKIKNGTFHRVKIVMDSLVVISAIAFSLLFLGNIYGVREGTILSAVIIGRIMPSMGKLILPTLRYLTL